MERLTCLIDSLGPGGAQRQIAMVAGLLARQGVAVTVLTYQPNDFFQPILREAGAEHQCVRTGSRLRRVGALRSAIRRSRPDVVLSFLPASNIYAELAALPGRRWGLVASERSLVQPGRSTRLRLRLHGIADYVTANSHTSRLRMERLAPRMAPRLVTVYNAVDLSHFYPAEELDRSRDASRASESVRIVVAASYQRLKNLLRFV